MPSGQSEGMPESGRPFQSQRTALLRSQMLKLPIVQELENLAWDGEKRSFLPFQVYPDRFESFALAGTGFDTLLNQGHHLIEIFPA